MSSSPAVTGGGTVDFGRAFQFFFEDPQWVRKALIGGGLYLAGTLLIFLLGAGLLLYAIVAGYAMSVMQRSYAGDPRPLPEWEDYGRQLRDGLKLMGLFGRSRDMFVRNRARFSSRSFLRSSPSPTIL